MALPQDALAEILLQTAQPAATPPVSRASTDPVAEPVAEETIQQITRTFCFCSACGTRNGGEAAFCESCGAGLRRA